MIAEIISLLIASGAAGAGSAALLGPAYRPQQRAVTNWRFEAIRSLDVDWTSSLKFLLNDSQLRLPRCIRLNNYWCIKSARWNGEIATDNEGHVAFASANEGAAVAVQLLRRYYLEFGRKSAMSIVTRWAPAQCGFVAARAPSVRRGVRSSADRLTTRGIGSTLRARYLASRGGKQRRSAVRSVVRDRLVPMMRAPAIASGMGERPGNLSSLAAVRGPSTSVAARIGASDKGGAAIPRIACTGEALRIRNYAGNIIKGVAESIDADLKLFEPDGAPAPNLARVLANMAAVEIGPWRAAAPLISLAVEDAGAQVRARRENAEERVPAKTGQAGR